MERTNERAAFDGKDELAMERTNQSCIWRGGGTGNLKGPFRELHLSGRRSWHWKGPIRKQQGQSKLQSDFGHCRCCSGETIVPVCTVVRLCGNCNGVFGHRRRGRGETATGGKPLGDSQRLKSQNGIHYGILFCIHHCGVGFSF